MWTAFSGGSGWSPELQPGEPPLLDHQDALHAAVPVPAHVRENEERPGSSTRRPRASVWPASAATTCRSSSSTLMSWSVSSLVRATATSSPARIVISLGPNEKERLSPPPTEGPDEASGPTVAAIR